MISTIISVIGLIFVALSWVIMVSSIVIIIKTAIWGSYNFDCSDGGMIFCAGIGTFLIGLFTIGIGQLLNI